MLLSEHDKYEKNSPDSDEERQGFEVSSLIDIN
jgi:hypothetical protein